MPYKSRAQAAYFNIHRDALEKEGVDVDEWNAASRGKKLPKHVKTAGLEAVFGNIRAKTALFGFGKPSKPDMTNAPGWEIDPARSFAEVSEDNIPWVREGHKGGIRFTGDHPDVDEHINDHVNSIDWSKEPFLQELHLPDGRVLNLHLREHNITGVYGIGPAKDKFGDGVHVVQVGNPMKTAFPMIPHKALIAGDIAGLGILAEPTIHKWISGPDAVSEREKDLTEVGGLGVLAATQIPHLTGHVAEGHPMLMKEAEFWATEYVKMAAVPLAPVRGRARRSPNPGVTTMLNPSLTPDTSGV